MATRTCPHCGAPMPPNDRFCGECGQAVDAPVTGPSGTVTPPPAGGTPPPPPGGMMPPPPGASSNIPGGGMAVPGGVMRPPPTSEVVTGSTTQRRRGLSLPIIIGGVIVLCLVLACGGVGLYALSQGGTATSTPEATAVAVGETPAATPTKVKIGGLGTARPTLGPTLEAPTQPPAGQVLFQEDFSDPQKYNWNLVPASDNKEYVVDILDGQMQMELNTQPLIVWTTAGRKAGDFVLDVDAIWLDGPQENDFGPVMRLNPPADPATKDEYYTLSIRSTGQYSFWLRKEGKWHALIDWTDSSAVKQNKGDVNHLRVQASGSTFTFFINDQQVDTYDDTTFSSGEFGLYAATDQVSGLKVAFDNYTVTKP